MDSSVSEHNASIEASAIPPDASVQKTHVNLRSLGGVLALAPYQSESEAEAIRVTLELTSNLIHARLVAFVKNESHVVTIDQAFQLDESVSKIEDLEPSLRELAKISIQDRTAQTARLKNGSVVIAVPIVRPNQLAEAMVALIDCDAKLLPSYVQTLQILAAYFAQWRGRFGQPDSQARLDRLTSLIEVVTNPNSTNYQDAARNICEALRQQLGAKLVVLTTVKGTQVSIQAISSSTSFDTQSEVARASEQLVQEVLVLARQSSDLWFELDRDHTDVVGQFLRMVKLESVHAIRLCDAAGNLTGIALVADASTDKPKTSTVELVAGTLGQLLYLHGAARPTWTQRSAKFIQDLVKDRGRRVYLIPVAILLCLMAVPLPLKVKCSCVVEPVERRFVAAPWEGRLDQVLFEPGDLVQEGEIIARMSIREIESRLDQIDTELSKAQKEKIGAMASQETAQMQLAKLKIEGLEVEQKQLLQQLQDLEIKSPSNGVVISGDLKNLQGALLKKGQTLAEIGKLVEIIVEVEIPDVDIMHARVGDQVKIKLDSIPSRTFRGELTRLRPRSEQRSEKNVFVGEVRLDNDQDFTLRPGMSGKAKVIGRRRPLGWNLFHKAWDRLIFGFGW